MERTNLACQQSHRERSSFSSQPDLLLSQACRWPVVVLVHMTMIVFSSAYSTVCMTMLSLDQRAPLCMIVSGPNVCLKAQAWEYQYNNGLVVNSIIYHGVC